MMRDTLQYWIALNGISSVSFKQFDALVTHFNGELQYAFCSDPEELKLIPHMTSGLINKLSSGGAGPATDPLSPFLAKLRKGERLRVGVTRANRDNWIENELRCIEKENIDILTYKDAAYPTLLREIPDPPPVLYIKGKLPKTQLWLAVVGTRKATAYGLSVTQSLCHDLASSDITIVSGLARGIDTKAHQAVLEEKGNTVAVLGNGLGVIYPRENRKCYEEISEKGALISEFPIHMQPDAFHFPRRNRIVSGLCQGTIVIEAPHKSGAMITARLALEQGREVFAVPGMVSSPNAQGPNQLIQDGAKLALGARDILEEFGLESISLTSSQKIMQSLSDEEKNILELLSVPSSFEDLLGQSGLAPSILSHALLSCEMNGYIHSQGSQYYRSQKTFNICQLH